MVEHLAGEFSKNNLEYRKMLMMKEANWHDLQFSEKL